MKDRSKGTRQRNHESREIARALAAWEQDYRHERQRLLQALDLGEGYSVAPSPGQKGAAFGLASKYGGDWFRKAVGEAALQGFPGDLRYIRGILKNWRNGSGPSVEPQGDFDRRYRSGRYGYAVKT